MFELVFPDLEVFFFKSGDIAVLRIRDRGVDKHQVHIDFQGWILGRGLRFIDGGIRRLLTLTGIGRHHDRECNKCTRDSKDDAFFPTHKPLLLGNVG